MITINWSAGYASGYGDIISPLCYAQNQGELKNDMVTLILNWRFSKEKENKHNPDGKVDFLLRKFNFCNVNVIHRYDEERHVKNLNEELKRISTLDPMHNVYFPIEHSAITPKYNVVCSPLNNLKSFDDFANGSRKWKDALTNEQWQNLINQPNTLHVDYRMPMYDVIDILYNCRVFVGYHGSCSWLARMMGLPIKIYTNNIKLTKYSFPWSLEQDEDLDYEKGLTKVEHFRMVRDEYVNSLRRS